MTRATQRIVLVMGLVLVVSAGSVAASGSKVETAVQKHSQTPGIPRQQAPVSGAGIPPGDVASPCGLLPVGEAEDDRELVLALRDPSHPDGGASATIAAAESEAAALADSLTASPGAPVATSPPAPSGIRQPAIRGPFLRGARPLDAEEVRDRQRPVHKQPQRTPLGAG